jgi:dTDP-4-dehydrorhamnose reductase
MPCVLGTWFLTREGTKKKFRGHTYMKVLILGVNGMLGHKIYQTLFPLADVVGTMRGNYIDIQRFPIFRELSLVFGIEGMDIKNLQSVIKKVKPDILINCIGVIKQVKEAKDRTISIKINSLLPHELNRICGDLGIRLIHISTDCVFSGKKGNYSEIDLSDAEDIYGKTKYLGEVTENRALTIRTSLIGRELYTTNGLVEWLISNSGNEVNGFTNAIFSGFPSIHLAQIIRDIIFDYPSLTGLYHISSEPINKYILLCALNKKFELNVKVNEYSEYHCDRSLNSSLFQSKTGFKALSWERMIDEFFTDSIQYREWR